LTGIVYSEGMATYARFEVQGQPAYGLLDGDAIQELKGGLFDEPEPTGKSFPLGKVKLLTPHIPSKILAVGLNYKSHLGTRTAPSNPEIFYKPVSCLQGPDGPIRIPADAVAPHFEGELVVVMGRAARDVSAAEANQYVFGVTCGNDVSERSWQANDRQWWRAKGCDTFGPAGPFIVTGLNYGDLLLETRVNGAIAQSQRTSDLLFDVPTVISFISRFLTLEPGDLIYTGTPGNTFGLKPGDVVEVQIEGIGTLRNPVE
jgi:2-keto-4-pentenoate hydratase/2-oxohepta-3-ene-1,7-dioic acid hydratase in catechol pathway